MVRRAPRYHVVLPIRYDTTSEGTSTRTGWTQDLSQHGACVELPEHLAPGTALALVVETETGAIPLSGTVVWSDASNPAGPSHLHGLQFTPGSDVQDRLGAWLQRHPPQASRMAASLPVRCRQCDGVSPLVEGWTADIGNGGCALFLPERLPVGTLVDLLISTPCGEVPAQGVVVWEGSKAPGSQRLVEHGFRFTRRRPDQAGAVEDILETILASRGGPDITAGPS